MTCNHADYCLSRVCPEQEGYSDQCRLSLFLGEVKEMAEEHDIEPSTAATLTDRKRIALLVGRIYARMWPMGKESGADPRQDWLQAQMVHHAVGLACPQLDDETWHKKGFRGDPLPVCEEPRQERGRLTEMVLAVITRKGREAYERETSESDGDVQGIGRLPPGIQGDDSQLEGPGHAVCQDWQ
jgi:hypothetical protein